MVIKTPAIDLTRYIEKRHFGDRPHIRGRRVPVWVIAYTVRDNPGYGVPELMVDFDLSEIEVLVYVNDWTMDFGERGREAVATLLRRGHEAGVIPNPVELEFVG